MCGRHVGLRAKMFEVSDDAYKSFIINHHKLHPDAVVSLLTFAVTHKGKGHELLGGKFELVNRIPMHDPEGSWSP